MAPRLWSQNKGPVISLEAFVPVAKERLPSLKQDVLLIVFLNEDGAVQHELAPESQKINKEYCL
jgi:hypothetical protein